jgi:DNA-binding MarR family transcriptional regulator
MTKADPREIWAILGELVLDNERRREVAEAVGLSFGKVRAIRRIARRPMSMSELAAALNVDPPNATTIVDDLEQLGLAERQPHPTDRRAKVVTATRKGIAVARRADEILSTPPPGLGALPARDLEELLRIVRQVRDEAP